MNAGCQTRQLIIRVMGLCAGIGVVVAALPELDAARTAATPAQIASRQQLSIQLVAW